MTKKLIARAVLALAFLSAAPILPAFAQYDPSGLYQAENKESRYQVSLCGNGTALCALLYWIQPDKIGDRNRPYMGKYLFFEAKQATKYQWKGQANILGNLVDGRIKVTGGNSLVVTACLLILCDNFPLARLTEEELAAEDPAGLAPGFQQVEGIVSPLAVVPL